MNQIIRLALFLLILTPLNARSQFVDGKFIFPDIPGYHTLKCDFHMHTVFSDGTVWPTVRVREAVNEGLDAIAITEHLEYWSHKNYIQGDHNSSYEIAKPYADKNGLILVRGCEITKGMPPGHFNFLFIEDANGIDSVDWKMAILQAKEQGAFILWNHPGWRMENTIPVWYDEHSWLISEGLLDGIEVVNENEYYPLAWQWCIDSNLTILGNSDIHAPVDYFYDRSAGEHRPITLVFAKEKNEDGIREALDSGRTAIYYKDRLIGDAEILEDLFRSSCIEITEYYPDSDKAPIRFIHNTSSFAFKISHVSESGTESEAYVLKNGQDIKVDKFTDGYWRIENMFTAPGKYLIIDDLKPFSPDEPLLDHTPASH